MTNEEMKAGRFLKLQLGKRRMARIREAFSHGGFVAVWTATRKVIYRKEWAGHFYMSKSGSVYILKKLGAFKGAVCIDFNDISVGL